MNNALVLNNNYDENLTFYDVDIHGTGAPFAFSTVVRLFIYFADIKMAY